MDRLDQKAGRKPSPVVKETSTSVKEGAEKAVKYIEDLASYKIWGFQDVNMDDLLRPMRLSVVDLAGMEQYVAQYAVQKTLAEIWRRATTGKLPHPVFVVLEEAHNFVPASGRGGGGECARWINRVASEGRKFKVFLVVITQRPGKIDPDTLSQCGSQVIMKLTNPTDQEAVRRASESLYESLFRDLPGLNTGEAIVVGQLTRVPVMMRVGQRESAEGGSDVDVVKALAAARSDNDTHRLEQTSVFAEADRSKRTEIAQEI
jgi:DNA helicase HerA-like ATPase